jgi:hypothetical protein
MNEDVMSMRGVSTRHGRHRARNRPDEPCQLAGDGRRHFGFGLATRDQLTEARRQSELGLPCDVADDLRQRFLPIRMLAPNPWNPLICPGRFGEETADVGIARLRNGAASDTRPA